SILYARRPEEIVRAFSIVPEYLSSRNVAEVRDLMDYGVALGRRFRSLKLWFVLRHLGREGVIEGLRRHVALARSFADRVDASPGWELEARSPLAAVAFRRTEPGLDGPGHDELNHRILGRVNASGEVF